MAIYLGRTWTRRELLEQVGQIEQIAGITPIEYREGRRHGLQGFEVYTGSGLTFHVLADRALDISACHFQGHSLAWRSPAGDVDPAYFESGGLGWLRSFQGGLFVTCGLDQFGAPTDDAGEQFGIHGRISNLPAQQVAYRTQWEGDDYLLEISGQVRQARLFGENLRLHRQITTELGSREITVKDTVVNVGFEPQPHMFLYHCNFGFPLIGPQTVIHLYTTRSEPRDAEAAKGLEAWHLCQLPTPNYQEQVFLHQPIADVNNQVHIELHNPMLDFGLRMTYGNQTLPYLYQWKMMGQGAYVMGLEPANCTGIGGRAAARADQVLPELEPGESRAYTLQFEVIS